MYTILSILKTFTYYIIPIPRTSPTERWIYTTIKYALESLTDVESDLKFRKTISFTFCTLFVKYPRVSHLKYNLFIVSYNLSSELNVIRSSQIQLNKIIFKKKIYHCIISTILKMPQPTKDVQSYVWAYVAYPLSRAWCEAKIYLGEKVVFNFKQ